MIWGTPGKPPYSYWYVLLFRLRREIGTASPVPQWHSPAAAVQNPPGQSLSVSTSNSPWPCTTALLGREFWNASDWILLGFTLKILAISRHYKAYRHMKYIPQELQWLGTFFGAHVWSANGFMTQLHKAKLRLQRAHCRASHPASHGVLVGTFGNLT